MSDSAPMRIGNAPSFALHIEELILHGFEQIDRHEVASAIERELARLLREPATQDRLRRRNLRSGESQHRLDAGAFMVAHDATPSALGVQLAQAIYRSLPGIASGAARSNRARG